MRRPGPAALLRAASVITLLYFLGHTAGIPWTPASEADAAGVVEAMRAVRFDGEGASRTYWDFYQGFGLIISAFLLAQAVLLWQLGGIARAGRARLVPVLCTSATLFALNALLGFLFFFAVPGVMAVAIGLCILAAAAASPARETRR